jgi:hypothetical protein
MSCKFLALVVCAIALFSPGSAHAQVLYGSLVGNVTDESGAAIPNATVIATNHDTNFTRQGATNQEGLYSFPNVPPGNYSVKITAAGFAEFTSRTVQVTGNSTIRLDAPMKISGIAEQVTVTAETEVAVLQTDRAEVRHEIPSTQIENLPVPVGRNYQTLFTTLPGFEMAGSPREGRMGGCNPSRSRAFNVNGTSRSTTSTSIDGAQSQHIWAVGNSSVVPSLESIETVNVATNSFDAEQGLAGGAVINVQIKSGTNDFHGSLFEYHHNQHLRARHLLPARPIRAKASSFRTSTAARSADPSCVTSCSSSRAIEGSAERENSTAILSVPTDGGTARCNFSGYTHEDSTIPLTGNSNGTGRLQFAGNIIPAERLNPIVQRVLGYLPPPNYQNPVPQLSSESEQLLRLDARSPPTDGRTIRNSTGRQTTASIVFGSISLFDFDITNPTAFGDEVRWRPRGRWQCRPLPGGGIRASA